jgi:hypothetical protein
MNNHTSKQNNFQHNSRRDLLEATKLSRVMPDFDNTPSKTVVAAVCAGCGGLLNTDDTLQLKFSGCRKCISIFARIDAAIDEASKRKRRELLERFTATEVKQ